MQRKTILLITQVYPPDPAAVGRLMSDVATELAQRGDRVVVVTANRGYDDPSIVYPSVTTPEGVEVRRLGFSSFGKRSLGLRVLAGVVFTLQALKEGLRTSNVACVVVSTVPPMGAFAALAIGILRRTRIVYWPMDLNPDQVLSLKLKTENSPSVRLMHWLNVRILRRANAVVTLDRFMADRLIAKEDVREKLSIVPPWPETDSYKPIDRYANPFLKKHGLEGKTVIMYSGTLGPSNPVETLLTAAERFEGNHRLVFLFVGGGSGMAKIRERARPNVLTLPYEPLDRMPFSLAAGDVQVVSLGDSMVGIVHPCKVYGAMASSRPILSLGPPESHVADLVAQSECGWHIAHGDVEGAVRAIEQILSADAEEMLAKGSRGRQLIIENRSKARSCGRVCDVIEREAGVREPFAEPRAATTIADRSDPRWQRQKSGLRSADGSVDAQDVTTQPFVG